MKKRFLAFILALVMMIMPLSISASAQKNTLGDVDGDGKITSADCAIVERYVAHWSGYYMKENGKLAYPGDLSRVDVPFDGTYNRTGFQVGYGRDYFDYPTDNTVPLAGYDSSYARRAIATASPISATSVAFNDGEGTTALVISVDLVNINVSMTTKVKKMISDATGLPVEYIRINCTHSHESVESSFGSLPSGMTARYQNEFFSTFIKAAQRSLKDLDRATVSGGSFQFDSKYGSVRRYFARFKDSTGKIYYGWLGPNDGRYYLLSGNSANYFGNVYSEVGTSLEVPEGYEISYTGRISHETEADNEVQYLVVERENQEPIIMFNWGNHAAGSTSTAMYFSGDFVYYAREYIEEHYGKDCNAVFFQGACGNTSGSNTLLSKTNSSGAPDKYDYKRNMENYNTAAMQYYENSCESKGNALGKAVIENLGDKKPLNTGKIRVDADQYEARKDLAEYEIAVACKKTGESRINVIQGLYSVCCAAYDIGNNNTKPIVKSFQNYVPDYYISFYYASHLKSRLESALKIEMAKEIIEKSMTKDYSVDLKNGKGTTVKTITVKTADAQSVLDSAEDPTLMPYSVLTIGTDIAFAFTPYEMYDTNGMTVKHGYRLNNSSEWVEKKIKDKSGTTYTVKIPQAVQDETNTEGSPFKITFMCELSDGAFGYIPTTYASHFFEENIPAGYNMTYPSGYEIYSNSYYIGWAIFDSDGNFLRKAENKTVKPTTELKSGEVAKIMSTGDDIADALVEMLCKMHSEAAN